MREETGLDVRVRGLAYVAEFARHGFHSLELYFWTDVTGGALGEDLFLTQEERAWREELRFVYRNENLSAPVLPEGLWERLWDDVDAGPGDPVYLGIRLGE